MRISRTIVLAAMAAAGMFVQPAADANADHRWHMQFGWPFAQGYYAPRPRYYYEPEYYDPYYDEDEAYYDPYYYEPPPRRKKRAQRLYDDELYDEPPPRKKKKKLSTAKAYAEPSLDEPAPSEKKNPAVTAAAPAKKPAAQTAAGSVSCDKARTIIGEYGFASITPTDCEGSELGFKALRDGKSFSIKVSSLNGELTEVKRQ
jgi:hypothetical protein